jgi:molybdopterin/thiamine biosynthesis adenylyltransferase
MGIMNDSELKKFVYTKVLVIGVGGLGGYIASSLARIGVSSITIVDYDCFDDSNLNRQMFSTLKTLKKPKVDVVKRGLLDINPNLKIRTIHAKLDKTFDLTNFENIDIVFDAVDNIESKILLEKYCNQFNIPLIHGAIAGWYGQLGIIMPGSNILNDLYNDNKHGIESELMSPTFTPGVIGNMMISEFVKFILEKEALVNKILYVDLLDHEYRIMYKK